MKLEIITEKKQPLLARKEVVYTFDFAKACTPSLSEIKKAVVEQSKAKEDRVVLHGVEQQFGSTSAKVRVDIYDSEDAFKQFGVIDKKKNRNKKPEEVKAEEKPAAPAEAPKAEEEVKAEAPAEEKPVEEKKE